VPRGPGVILGRLAEVAQVEYLRVTEYLLRFAQIRPERDDVVCYGRVAGRGGETTLGVRDG
jgi:hypothetical protein